MKLLVSLFAAGALVVAACGGDDDGGGGGNGGNGVTIAAADADRVAHAGLPTLEDLPGDDWAVIGQDEFGSSGSGPDFLTLIQGNPACESLENLATLEGVFGGDDDDEEPIGQAKIEFESQDPDALIPTNLDVEIEIDESAGGSRAEFEIVKGLFESDETADCLIAVLNSQFAEGGPAGLEIEVKKGSGSASAPQNGARMAFDIEMSFAGVELELAMQMYFWPYGNASVQAMFLGTTETLSDGFVSGVLEAVDDNLTAAAGE